jgi:hypothetical protein
VGKLVVLGVSLVLAVVAGPGGCSVGRRTTIESQSGDTISQSTSIALHGSAAKAALEKARQLMRDGQFDEATRTLLPLAQSATAMPEERGAALLELGRVHVDVLNPKRDPATARVYFQKVLAQLEGHGEGRSVGADLVQAAQWHLERLSDQKE